MNLRRIEAFLAIAEAGSISRAAAQLGLAQSVVSRHLATLEEELGCRLFLRNGRGVTPTEAALRLAPRLRASLDDMQEATQAATQDAAQPGGDVRVGVMPAVTRPLVSRLFERISAAYPRIKLHFIEGFTGQLHDQLFKGSIDIGVLNRYGPSAQYGEQRLAVVDSLVIGPPGSVVLRPADIAFKSLAALPLVLPSRPNRLRAVLDQTERRTGTKLNVVCEADSLMTIKELVVGAKLFTILSHHAMSEEIAGGLVSAARIVKPGISRSISLAIANNESNSRATRIVAAEIRRLVVDELLPTVWTRSGKPHLAEPRTLSRRGASA